MSLWTYLESYRLILCHIRHEEKTLLYSIPKTRTGCKPHILPLLSALLNVFKLKEFGFLKNRLLPCLAGCTLSCPSQYSARTHSPTTVPSSPWWRAEDRCFSHVLQSINSTRSQERRTCPSACVGGFLQDERAVLPRSAWARKKRVAPWQGGKQEGQLGGQPGRGCLAPPAPQGTRASVPAKDSSHGALAITDTTGAACCQEPLSPGGYLTLPEPGPTKRSEWLHLCCWLDLHPWYPFTAISFLYCYSLSYSFLTS